LEFRWVLWRRRSLWFGGLSFLRDAQHTNRGGAANQRACEKTPTIDILFRHTVHLTEVRAPALEEKQLQKSTVRLLFVVLSGNVLM
jgi:hypothetical protein